MKKNLKDIENEILKNELQKPFIRNFIKRKVFPRSKNNIWSACPGDM